MKIAAAYCKGEIETRMGIKGYEYTKAGLVLITDLKYGAGFPHVRLFVDGENNRIDEIKKAVDAGNKVIIEGNFKIRQNHNPKTKEEFPFSLSIGADTHFTLIVQKTERQVTLDLFSSRR